MRRSNAAVLSCLAGGALLLGGLSPAWADEGGADAEPAAVAVGGFALGDGLEASIDEQAGSLTFGVPVNGIALTWDSRATGADRHGLGAGWGLGLGAVRVEGGVWVYPASGGAFAADASAPSGLAGYPDGDVRFDQTPGATPARARSGAPDGSGAAAAADRLYSYVLHELGGTTTYFDGAGNPIVRVTATGRRTDWFWRAGPRTTQRLTSVTDADGVVTSLTWDEPHESVVVRRGANLPGGGEPWTIRLEHGRVAGTTDPAGGRVDVTSDSSGMVTGVSGVSGSRTAVEWRPHADGVPRVERLVTSGTRDDAWSTRSWRPAGAALPSGWPLVDGRLPGSSDGAPSGPLGAHSTIIGDGDTEVESTYNARGSLIERVTTGATGSGRRVLQEQSFRYPGTDEHGTPASNAAELPASWSRPSVTTITFRDDLGGERSVTQRTEFDRFGRLIAQTGVDGVATSYTYDGAAFDASGTALPPIGLQTAERRVAPDGLVEEVRHELNEAGTAVVATTEYSGRVEGELTMTSRTEYRVEADGFVSERGEQPAAASTDGAAEPGAAAVAPRVTRWARSVDLPRGTVTVHEMVAADTSAAASTSSTASLVHGGVLATTGPAGEVTTTTYDRLGRVTAVTDQAGRTTATAYETAQAEGRNAVTVTGPDGVATTEVRDEFGRVVSIVDNIHDGRVEPGYERLVESREYPAPGVVQSTDAWGAVSAKRVDVFGRTIELTAPNGLRTVTHHDDVEGTVTSGVSPTARLADAAVTSTVSTDAAGRTTGTTGTRSDGGRVPELATAYDGFGRPIATEGGAVAMATTYDVHGAAIEQRFAPAADRSADTMGTAATTTDHGERTAVAQAYDAFGSSTQKTVSDATSSYAGIARTSDVLGRTIAETDQAGITTSTTYTPDGLVATTATSTGRRTVNEYDETTRALRRSTTSAPGDSTVTTAHEYDPPTGLLVATFDPADRAGTELAYSYDAFGNIRSVTYPDGSRIEHEYDEHGRRVATTDIAGNTTRYTHDVAGLLTSASQTDERGAPLASVEYEYDEYGRLANAARGNGVTTAYEYDATSGLTRELTTRGGETTADRSYTYDATGRLTSRTDRVRDGDGDDAHRAESQPGATTTAYVYDAFDRLIASTVHDGDSAEAPARSTTAYTVTVAGDIAHETSTSAPGTPDARTSERAFEYSTAGALQAITTNDANGTTRATQEYDVDGNLVRDVDGTTFDYDAADRVISRTTADGAITRTSYWADGARRALTDGDGDDRAASTFYWDDDTLVNDAHTGTGSGDSGTGSYLIGAIRHARTVTSDGRHEPTHHTRYLGTDRHGNTTDLTDERGEITARYTYTDYGVTTELRLDEPSAHVTGEAAALAVGDATRNPFQYAAGQTDPSGDQHLRSRLYDARTMRFTTPDPAPMLTDYGYAGLNPIMKVDPSGRAEIGDYLVNGVLVGAAIITGFFTATSLGVPTGGMSFGAYAAWTAGLFAVIGDVASTGIAIAEIVYDAGVRFMSDEQREILRVSGIVIGAVSAVAGPIAGAYVRQSITEDSHSYRLAIGDPHAPVDTSPVRANQLRGLLPSEMARLFSRKFRFQVDTLPEHYSAYKTQLAELASRFMPAPNASSEAVHAAWKEASSTFTSNMIALRKKVATQGAKFRDKEGGTRNSVESALNAIIADKKLIDAEMMARYEKYSADALRAEEPVNLFGIGE